MFINNLVQYGTIHSRRYQAKKLKLKLNKYFIKFNLIKIIFY